MSTSQEDPAADVGTVLEEHHHPHVLSWQLLVMVWLALMGFTALTVYQATLDLGGWDLQIAMMIATTKALLVALIFMHLRWDRPFNGLVFVSSLVFAGLFVAISMLDTGANQPEIETRRYDQPLGTRPDYAAEHAAHAAEHSGDHAEDHSEDHGEGGHGEEHSEGDHSGGSEHGEGEHAAEDHGGEDH